MSTDKMSQLKDELENERAIVSRIWVQLGSPTYAQLNGRSIYDLIDEMKAELAAAKAECWRLRESSPHALDAMSAELTRLRAELAADRARLDWLESDVGMDWQCDNFAGGFVYRAKVDTAMKEAGK
jgi:hypothetical protein